jgi:DNA-binding response OmpR family regulator
VVLSYHISEEEREMYNILICDDEQDIVNALKIYLADPNYNILEAFTGVQALKVMEEQEVHLVIMDIMMPEMDGISAMVKIREHSNVPVILLTAKSEDTDKILGLNVGADDYITKPFNPVEVIARVRSQLRRYMRFGGNNEAQEKTGATVLRNGGLELDDNAKTLTRDGEPVNLTPTEMMLLKFFMENPDKVFSPKEIYRKVWNDDPFGAENTVTVHIRHLREKIEIDPAKPDYLKVVWGHGYKMEKKKPLEKITRSDS